MRLETRARDRAVELGRIGRVLVGLRPWLFVPEEFIDWGIVKQLICIETFMKNDKNKKLVETIDFRDSEGMIVGPTVVVQLLAVAMSVLCSDVSVQLPLSDLTIKALVDQAFEPLSGVRRWPAGRTLLAESKQKNFPVKTGTPVEEKANLYLTDIIDGMLTHFRSELQMYVRLFDDMYGLTNDQAAMCLLFGVSISWLYKQAAPGLAVRACQQPANGKALTVVLKGLGANSRMLGAVFTETQCLQGRGVGRVDMKAKVLERTGAAGRANTPDLFSEDELRAAVNRVLDDELPEQAVEYEEVDSFWSRRWLWCVNGGHSRVLEREAVAWKCEMKGRMHRRAAMEHWTNNPVKMWDGRVLVSASEKLEPGKTRLLLSCDTVSYACFEHFLRPIEKVWKNKRTLLDPGSTGSVGIAARMKRLRGSVNVMMDYDAFNESHTLKAQQIVIDEVGKRVGYDPVWLKRLVDSFEDMHAYVGGVAIGKITATLMSGHRGTTFLNSILNTAYIYAAAPHLFDEYTSLHTGDDVVARFSSFTHVAELLNNLRLRGVKMNPMKQSVGYVSMEFLRMAVGDTYAVGYLPRSIVSLVNGNWVNTNVLEPSELLTTVVTTVRACINRSGSEAAGRLAVLGVNRRLKISIVEVERLLLGKIAVGNGPVYGNTGTVYSAELVAPKSLTDEMAKAMKTLPGKATAAYLTHHVSDIERMALTMTGMSVENIMKEASYAKSLSGAARSHTAGLRLDVTRREVMYGSHWAEDLNRRAVIGGHLEKYPILNLLKNRIPADVLVSLLRLVGVTASTDNARLLAWGAEASGKVFRCALPYADAAKLCKRCISGIIYAKMDIFM